MKKDKGEFKVTPWEVSGNVDYDKLVKQFGTSLISDKIKKRFSESRRDANTPNAQQNG